MYPVVNDVVHEVEHTTPSDRRVTACIIRPEVTHEGRILSTDCTAKGMVPSIECLGRDGILDGYIHRWHLAFWLTVVQIEHMAVERDILIQTKLARAVVNHDVTYRITTERILTIPYMGITTAETHVANDDIMGINLERFTRNHHALTRSCLSGDGDIRSTDNDWSLQYNISRYIEDNDAGTTLFASPTERTRTSIIEIGHSQHLAATATEGKHTATLSTWECRNLSLAQIVWTGSPWHIRTSCHCLLFYNRESHSPSRIRMGSPCSLHRINLRLSLLCNSRILSESCCWQDSQCHRSENLLTSLHCFNIVCSLYLKDAFPFLLSSMNMRIFSGTGGDISSAGTSYTYNI